MAAALFDMAALLDSDERSRVAALLCPNDRRRFVAVHGAVRVIVGRHLDAPPEQIRWRLGPHGKPELSGRWTGVQVNVSCSEDLALLAVTDRRPVGVDVQARPARLDAIRISARFFPATEARFIAAGDPGEQADRFTTLWARKEACVKAAGGRLTQGLPMPVHGPGSGIVVRCGEIPFLVRDLPVPAGFRAAVALAGIPEFRTMQHSWSS